MKSSNKRAGKILGAMTRNRAERFLLFMANTFIGHNDREQVLHKIWADYPDVFSPLQAIYTKAEFGKESIPLEDSTLRLAEGVRRAWDAPDARHREWHIFRLRQMYHELTIWTTYEGQREDLRTHLDTLYQAVESGVPGVPENLRAEIEAISNRNRRRLEEGERRLSEPPPDPTPLEAALYHLQNLGDLARHCLNSDCPAPYFVATKRWQHYCSPECSLPAQREAKRKWWNENRAKGRKSK